MARRDLINRDLINMESYQFDYVFDELDEDGKQIVFDSNDVTEIDTDQNKYITVTKDGKLTITDYRGGTESLRPALNRTPIVRVKLVTTNEAYTCDKVLDTYFVKLKIAEDIKPIDAIPAIKRSMEVYDICKGGELTIGTEEFNKELLSKLNLSMDEFARIFDRTEYIAEEDDKNPATVENVGNTYLNWDYQATGTYNLKWTISADEAKAYVGKVVTRTVALKSSMDPTKQIIFNFSAKIVAPKFDFVADGLIDNTLWVNGMIRINSEVPGEGKTIDFDQSLFRSFVTVKGVNEFENNNLQFGNVVRTVNGVATKPYSNDNYQAEFAFTYNQPVLGSLKDGRKVTLVYNSAASLSATLTNAEGAVVMRGEVAKLDTTTGTLTFANTEIAQLLLNEDREFLKVRVQAKVKNTCADLYADVDGFAQVGDNGTKDTKDDDAHAAFDVVMTRPISSNAKSDQKFYHLADKGQAGTVLELGKVVKFTDWRDVAFAKKPIDYYTFYGVTDVIVKTKADGKTVDGVTTKGILSDKGIIIEYDPTGKDVTKQQFGKIVYSNNGVQLSQGFEVTIPIEIKYVYGTIKTTVTVPVINSVKK